MKGYLTVIARCGTCNKEINRAEHVPIGEKEGVGLMSHEISFCDQAEHNQDTKYNTNVVLDWREETEDDYSTWLKRHGYPETYSAKTVERLEAARLALSVTNDVSMENLLEIDNVKDLRVLVVKGVKSLQSLDDLGDEEANKRAWKDLKELEKILKSLDLLLTKLKIIHDDRFMATVPSIWRIWHNERVENE